MNKVPCNVIQDLLVLYEDDVCSAESKTLIEEHIGTCEECRKIYEKMQAGIPDITLDNDKELEEKQSKMFIKSAKKFARNLTFKHMILIGFLILALLGGDYIYTTHFKDYVHSVPTSDVKITELYQLNNGDIYCTLKTKEPFYMIRSDSIQVPENKVWQDYDQGWHEVQFQYPGLFTDDLDVAHYSRDHMTFVFPMEENGTSSWGDNKPYHYTAASVKCIGKSPKDVLTIWKKGQKIPQAPMEIEEKVITEYVNCGDLGKAFEQCKQLGISLEDLNIKDDILENAYENYYNIDGREVGHDESFTYYIYDENE